MTEPLPPGWAWSTLEQLGVDRSAMAIGPFGSSLKVSDYTPDGVPLVFVRHIRSRDFQADRRFVSAAKAEQLRGHQVVAGDVLITKMGEPPGDAAVYSEPRPAVITADCIKLTPHPSLSANYLAAAVESPACRNQVVAATSGVAQRKISLAKARVLRVPVAPAAEQQRIVAALAEQESRIDAAVLLVRAALRRVPLVRRSVLHRVMPDPLPDGWKMLTVEEAGTVELGRQRSPQYHSGPNMKPYLRVANVHEDRIDLSDVKEMDFPPEQLPRYELRPGDILLNEGQSPEFVGRPAMYRGELPGVCFTNSLIRFRPFDFVDGEYALLVFLRHLRFGRFQREAQITTNIAHMAAGRFKKVEFSVPPLDEQLAIVEDVRRDLSLLSAFESELRISLRRADTLRAAILAAAFRGELVPQDPADEPATELLARLRADRPTSARGRKKNGA